MMNDMIKNNWKRVARSSIFILIISLNFNCALLMMNGSNPVEIRSDIVVLKYQITGNVGFGGISLTHPESKRPLSRRHGHSLIVKNFTKLFNKDFFHIINEKVIIDCRYNTIKNFSYFQDYFNQKPFTYQMYYGPSEGYISFYDEMDQRGTWKMWSAAVDFFNKYYNCDYYLTGKFYMNFIEDSANKRIEIEPNILLILYDNKGYRVWSKLYKKQYFSEEKNQLTPDTTYSFVKNMLNDSKEEINNDLSFIQK